MFWFKKRQSAPAPGIDFAAEWRALQDKYADPAIELATTKQAIVVSAASVIDRLWNGHGGSGWDESCEDDYIAPLREHLVAREVFSESECERINDDLDTIVAVGRSNLERGKKTLDSCGTAVDSVVQRAVEWCRHFPEPIRIRPEDEYHGHF